MKITVRIDGKDVSVEKGSNLLLAARRAGATIPTLCHHEALKTHRACRLCLVEVRKEGKSRVLISCVYPLNNEGEEISTASPAVLEERRKVVGSLLERCPGSEPVRAIARTMGLDLPAVAATQAAKPTAAAPTPVDCILCGLCVRACNERIGAGALAFAEKGSAASALSPFTVNAAACIGCGACAAVCPTGVNRLVESPDGSRSLPFFGITVRLRSCATCGAQIPSEEQTRGIKAKAASIEEALALCPGCRRKGYGAKQARWATAAS
ncbi:MAG: 2Fe-2S iron-sulfur cluster-binding protein [Spirochaetota bacterium]